MEIDCWDMKKNIVKSNFKKKSEPIYGKNQIKNGGMMWNDVWEVTCLLCVINSRGH